MSFVMMTLTWIFNGLYSIVKLNSIPNRFEISMELNYSYL